MLQYLIILLDDTSTSYCYYKNQCKNTHLMPMDILHDAILFAMKENLTVQLVYPNYELPSEYIQLIETIDHSKIKPYIKNHVDDADVIVCNKLSDISEKELYYSRSYVLRLNKGTIFDSYEKIAELFGKIMRLNIIITDIDLFVDEDYDKYNRILEIWKNKLKDIYFKGKGFQLNLLSDRIILNDMNNCGAGDKSITIAPDGYFYICPAFYHVNDKEEYGLGKCKYNVGSLREGLKIPNSQLYKLEYAPICQECDAYHCKRCVWMNRKTTFELNTPGRQQCVTAHLERNKSRDLLLSLQKEANYMLSKKIKKINYLDPFEKIIKKNIL